MPALYYVFISLNKKLYHFEEYLVIPAIFLFKIPSNNSITSNDSITLEWHLPP
jgi:hypothetical protein